MIGTASERSSSTGFAVKMLGGAEEELAASALAQRRPVIISYNRL